MTATSTAETFVFELSLDGGAAWITAPSGPFSLQGATTVLVREVDADRGKGDSFRDTIRIDHILLKTETT